MLKKKQLVILTIHHSESVGIICQLKKISREKIKDLIIYPFEKK